MPSVSKAQQRLMGAAEHGAHFPAADRLRASMTHAQLHDFASGSEHGKPEHARPMEHEANKHGHAGMHAKAYADGAINERRGMHKHSAPRVTASGHGYSGSAAEAYIHGAQNEADGQHGGDADESA